MRCPISSDDEIEYDFGPLSDKQARNLAYLAAKLAEERMYEALGRNVVKRVLFMLGAGAIFAITYFSNWVHFGPPKT